MSLTKVIFATTAAVVFESAGLPGVSEQVVVIAGMVVQAAAAAVVAGVALNQDTTAIHAVGEFVLMILRVIGDDAAAMGGLD